MSKKIEQLKAAVDALAQEKADVEARHEAAVVELMAAEREARRNEKLSPAMRSVLTKLANGYTLMSSRFHLPESYWIENDGAHENVRRTVFRGLRSREAVDAGERDGTWRTRYSITEHGRKLVKSESSSESLPAATVLSV